MREMQGFQGFKRGVGAGRCGLAPVSDLGFRVLGLGFIICVKASMIHRSGYLCYNT